MASKLPLLNCEDLKPLMGMGGRTDISLHS